MPQLNEDPVFGTDFIARFLEFINDLATAVRERWIWGAIIVAIVGALIILQQILLVLISVAR